MSDELPVVESPEIQRRRRQRGATLLGLFGYGCAIIAMLTGLAYAGYTRGLAERVPRSAAPELDGGYLAAQLTRCKDAIDVSNSERAIPFCQEVLRLQPSNLGAQMLLATAQAILPTASPALPTSTPIPVNDADKATAFAQFIAANQRRDLDTVINIGGQLRVLDRNYEKASIEPPLYAALIARGNQNLNNGSLEAALFDYDTAATLRKLDERTESNRFVITLYQDGAFLFGADWEGAIAKLRQVYAISPGFRDTGRLLYQAYVRSGDTFAARLDACGAERRYMAASQLFSAPELDSKRSTAAAACANGGFFPPPAGTPGTPQAPRGTPQG